MNTQVNDDNEHQRDHKPARGSSHGDTQLAGVNHIHHGRNRVHDATLRSTGDSHTPHDDSYGMASGRIGACCGLRIRNHGS